MRELCRTFLHRLAALFRHRHLEDDLDEELRSHIEMAIDDLGAGLEQLRRAVGAPRPQRTSARDRDSGPETRSVSAQEA